MKLFSALLLLASLVCGVARADVFVGYSYFDGNAYVPLALDDNGDVLISPGSFSNYSVWNAGVELYTTPTYPVGFVADDGTPCAAPVGNYKAVCNGDREAYTTDGRDLYEIYPGSPALGTLIQNSMTGTVDVKLLLNSIGDVAFVDGRDEVQREIIDVPTPEPTSLTLALTGALAGIAGLRRRRAATTC